MLSDWYFCISLQLPLQQAVSHLQTLSTLREALAGDDLVPDEILADVTGMGAASGQWHLLHALAPVLAMRQSRRAQPVAQAVSRYCESVVDACVADERTAKELRGLLQAAVKGGVGGNSSLAQGVAELADRVLAAPPSTSPSSVPYFDLVDFAVPVIILSLLDMVSRRVPGAVRDVVAGADRAAWFARALEGGYGRHAMLLSVATAGRAGDQHAVRFLARPEAGVVDMEPDLLACFARSRFQRDGEPAAQLMAEYEIEAVTCRSLPAPVWHDGLPSAREIISQRLCGQPRMSRALAAVLWHVIMWELAAECDPADCAVRLRRWWGAPGDRGEHPFRKRANFRLTLPGGGERGTIRPINGLCDLRANELRLTVEQRADWQRSPRGQGAHGSARPPLFAGKPQVADGDVSQTSPNDGAAVFSPWAYRKSWHKTWDKVKPADYASRTAFPGLVDPVSMIRLLAGAALAVRVLRALPAEAGTQPHLLSLMLHAKDVVADCRFKPVRGAGDHGSEPDPHEVALMEVPQPVHGLILCVDRILDQAGMGSYARIDPASLARFILDRAYGQVPDGESPPAAQIRNLYRQAAPGFAVQWIKEVLSGYAPERGQQDGPGPDGGARWFAAPESGDPPALQILAQSIENEHSGGPRQAASLLLQLAPDQFAQFQRLQARLGLVRPQAGNAGRG